MESSEVSQFRYYILNGMWSKAESALERLGVDAQEGLLVSTVALVAVWGRLSHRPGCQVSHQSAKVYGTARGQKVDPGAQGPAGRAGQAQRRL